MVRREECPQRNSREEKVYQPTTPTCPNQFCQAYGTQNSNTEDVSNKVVLKFKKNRQSLFHFPCRGLAVYPEEREKPIHNKTHNHISLENK